MNNKVKSAWIVALSIGLLISFSSCEDDPQLPDNLVAFESAQLGFASDEDALTVNINFSRSASQAGSVTVSFVPNGVSYGTDFTTNPAAAANTLLLPVSNGASQVSFSVQKASGILLDGDETITFTITSVSDGLVLGTSNQLELSFTEILAQQALMDINGGGPTYPNKVFIDLSANRQTAVERATWDLGFFMGDDFRVILNSSVTMMARAIDKTDLTSVTAADTLGFASVMIVGANATNAAMAWIDDPTGDLTKTALAPVSATASENKVYIINRGAANPPSDPSEPIPSRGWKKVRVLRNGNGYTIQHADISSATFQEIQVAKDDQFNFRYISFQNGLVTVEPRKDRWDIAWTGFTNSTNLGGGFIPYYFQDIVLQSRNGVETAEQLTSAAGSYEAFGETNLAGVTWLTSQIGIGAKWRSGGGPGTAPAVRSDRFYLVKDVDGNIYKLRFTALTQDGQRGRPQIEFALVKKGT
ncbi:MAG: HmuY family protein [Cyclobacteriaceae bacterium]|nr:HmuY family protein [Cyclobacteriaceae bacterium]UYN87980.1 MAG: HmuY family protein [Cyclobacteriaceae bacterium]